MQVRYAPIDSLVGGLNLTQGQAYRLISVDPSVYADVCRYGIVGDVFLAASAGTPGEELAVNLRTGAVLRELLTNGLRFIVVKAEVVIL